MKRFGFGLMVVVVIGLLVPLSDQSPVRGAEPPPLCGQLAKVFRDEYGDTQYTFSMPNGGLVSSYDPAVDLMGPEGSLDVDRLDSKRAAKLGLGTRPNDASLQQEWREVAAGMRHRGVAPSAPCVDPRVQATQFTSHWAGYAARGAVQGNTYYGVSSSGTMPNVFLSTCNQETMTQWVGVSDTNLVQAGYIYSQNPGPLEHYPFYEFVGGIWDTGGVVKLGFPSVAEGERWFFSVRLTSSNRWTIVLSNLDTVETMTWVEYHAFGALDYLGEDGVFISERVTVNGSPTQYMAHSVARFRNSSVFLSDGSVRKMSQQSPDPFVMTSNGASWGTILGFPSNLNIADSNFSENFNACS